ncbi:MAG TPA: thioredoxin domain-containing protein [Candidatus Saccharimonadales bacterium]|nr:thioredoxin domain-containing protein [Candidatus Saccharimonadales bacterium]
MTSDSKFFIGVAAAAIIIIGGIVLITSRGKSSRTTSGDVTNINTSVGHKEGAGDAAPVKIVEFGDFQCPFCAQAEPALRQALKNNATTVQFIFRNFPLPQHNNALAAAYAAEAAGKQGKYFEMHNLIYDRQTAWENVSEPAGVFLGYARELGLDSNKFKSDYNSDAVKAYIKTDADYGTSIGVDQTPTFYVNGKKVTGVQTVAQWQTFFDSAKASK